MQIRFATVCFLHKINRFFLQRTRWVTMTANSFQDKPSTVYSAGWSEGKFGFYDGDESRSWNAGCGMQRVWKSQWKLWHPSRRFVWTRTAETTAWLMYLVVWANGELKPSVENYTDSRSGCLIAYRNLPAPNGIVGRIRSPRRIS